MSEREAGDALALAKGFCICEWEGFCFVCLDRAYAEIAGRKEAPESEPNG